MIYYWQDRALSRRVHALTHEHLLLLSDGQARALNQFMVEHFHSEVRDSPELLMVAAAIQDRLFARDRKSVARRFRDRVRRALRGGEKP